MTSFSSSFVQAWTLVLNGVCQCFQGNQSKFMKGLVSLVPTSNVLFHLGAQQQKISLSSTLRREWIKLLHQCLMVVGKNFIQLPAGRLSAHPRWNPQLHSSCTSQCLWSTCSRAAQWRQSQVLPFPASLRKFTINSYSPDHNIPAGGI